MNNDSLWTIFLNASLVNNFVLAYFLGICPFLGVSGKLGTATRMGGAVTFVMLISSICAYGIHLLLVAVDASLSMNTPDVAGTTRWAAVTASLGAGRWRTLARVTLPLLRPALSRAAAICSGGGSTAGDSRRANCSS